MKIDMSQVLKNLEGETFKENDKEVTLGSIACSALQTPYQDEPSLSGDDKCKRGLLAMRIHGETSIVISVEEVALIKKLIGKLSTPLVVAQAYEFLDPKPEEVTKEKEA